MKKTFFASIRFLGLSIIFFGGVYTLLITGIGQLFFPTQANGSQIMENEQVVGSTLIGQQFEEEGYFSGRSQGVSQLSPFAEEQASLVKERTKAQLAANPTETDVPIDLVTASASGVDPHISMAAAEFQMDRIAEIRNISQEAISAIIKQNSQSDLFSSREYVNIMQLNQALDELQ
ncbi:potassium-transporting ATPase subunit C [Desemzia incerta]|uniref:potassium-transporting ATPase subunit C n=1 Tax=Desemzia incerta TaxID=82801 RepID=UPI0016614012|nr:potassium-transporting ATPase subunit C [Desemzia incerta]